MMQGKEHDEIIIGQADEAGAEKRPLFQVERLRGFGNGQLACLCITLHFGQMAQVFHFQFGGYFCMDNLHGLPFDVGKSGAQGLVPPDDLVDATFQNRYIKLTF